MGAESSRRHGAWHDAASSKGMVLFGNWMGGAGDGGHRLWSC